MIKGKKDHPDETGLEIALLLGEYFLKIEDLHYGYWTPKLKKTIFNLPKAHEKHTDYLISHIPEQTKTILFVGCGTGTLAQRLISMGYEVDCVSPSPVLTKYARKKLQDKSHLYECTFEELKTTNLYDLILFRETLKKFDLEKGLKKSLKLLNKGGSILICEVFEKDVEDENPFGGALKLSKFYKILSKYPLQPIKDIDITQGTAPTMDIVNDFFLNIGSPIVNLLLNLLKNKYPQLSKLVHLKYKNKIEKMNQKYFSGQWSAEKFAFFHTYRLLLYQYRN